MFSAAVITVSDSRFRGEAEDRSGPAVCNELERYGIVVAATEIVPDEQSAIEQALRTLSERARLVITTGGTGVALRDVTPEATRAVCDRLIDGIAERMRAAGLEETPYAALSRALCGVRNQAIVLNLPGSPRGALTSLRAALPLLSHAFALLDGATTTHSSAAG